jgi:hypothetical protein
MNKPLNQPLLPTSTKTFFMNDMLLYAISLRQAQVFLDDQLAKKTLIAHQPENLWTLYLLPDSGAFDPSRVTKW